jgi:hypothetical protein
LPPPELAVPFPAEAQQAVGLLERPEIEFAALQYHRDFVTFGTKTSINHTHKEDDKPPEPRTAKFGEFAAKSG